MSTVVCIIISKLNIFLLYIKNFIFISFPVIFLTSVLNTLDASNVSAIPKVSGSSTGRTISLGLWLKCRAGMQFTIFACEVYHKTYLKGSIMLSTE